MDTDITSGSLVRETAKSCDNGCGYKVCVCLAGAVEATSLLYQLKSGILQMKSAITT